MIIKKLLILILLTVLIVSSLNFNYQVEATTNGHTQDDAIVWVNSKLNTKLQ